MSGFKTDSESSVTELSNDTLHVGKQCHGVELWPGLQKWTGPALRQKIQTSPAEKSVIPMCQCIFQCIIQTPFWCASRTCSNFWAITSVWKDFHVWVIFFFPHDGTFWVSVLFQSNHHNSAPWCLMSGFKTDSESSVTELSNDTPYVGTQCHGVELWPGL